MSYLLSKRLIDLRKLLVDGAHLVKDSIRLGRAGGGYLTCYSLRSPFDATSTAADVTTGIDLAGKTALVTGCNSGIGYETMRVLALRGAHVLGTARTMEKGQEACASVEGRCTPIVLDLSDFQSVVACGNQVVGMEASLDMLICNAGVLYPDYPRKNGLELHFLTNHLGHYLLTRRLLSIVLAAPQGRVVTLGSSAHGNVPDDGIYFDNLSGSGWLTPGYGHSKLANGLFSMELARRFEGTAATSNCVDPGSIVTNIFRHSDVPWNENSKGVKSLAQGAASTCYVAASPDLAGVSGRYFRNCNLDIPSKLMRNDRLAKKLWDVSEELVREYL